MIYDKEYVAKWREKAITRVEDLSVGMKVYSNGFPKKFIVKELITDAESYRRDNLSANGRDDTVPSWVVCEWESAEFRLCRSTIALADHNVGDSYNPWLLFRTEDECEEYKAGLKISLESYYFTDELQRSLCD